MNDQVAQANRNTTRKRKKSVCVRPEQKRCICTFVFCSEVSQVSQVSQVTPLRDCESSDLSSEATMQSSSESRIELRRESITASPEQHSSSPHPSRGASRS